MNYFLPFCLSVLLSFLTSVLLSVYLLIRLSVCPNKAEELTAIGRRFYEMSELNVRCTTFCLAVFLSWCPLSLLSVYLRIRLSVCPNKAEELAGIGRRFYKMSELNVRWTTFCLSVLLSFLTSVLLSVYLFIRLSVCCLSKQSGRIDGDWKTILQNEWTKCKMQTFCLAVFLSWCPLSLLSVYLRIRQSFCPNKAIELTAIGRRFFLLWLLVCQFVCLSLQS